MSARPEYLPCPGCLAAGATGRVNIGTRRSSCKVCNNFARGVDREVRNRFKTEHPETFERYRDEARRSLHRKYVEEASR